MVGDFFARNSVSTILINLYTQSTICYCCKMHLDNKRRNHRLDKGNSKSPEVYRIAKKPIIESSGEGSSTQSPLVKVLLSNKNANDGNVERPANQTPKILSKNPKIDNVKVGHVLSIINEFAQPKEMTASIQMIDDSLSFNYEIRDYLSGQNKNYNIVGIIGPQGTGKSTLLSMLAGNDQMDMYRQYIFRPCPKEAFELCRHQTTKIWMYVSHETRTIFIDTQAINSASLYEDFLKLRRRQGSHTEAFRLESLQLLMLIVNICHTLVLCFDWFIDLNMVRELMTMSLFSLDNEYRPTKTNLIFVHHRAKPSDFNPSLVQQRVRVLSGIFEKSLFDCFGGINMSSLGVSRYSQINSTVNYVLLPDIKPRMRYDVPHVNASEVPGINYSCLISALRLKIFEIRPHNLLKCTNSVPELEWFILAGKFWNRIIQAGYSIIEENFEEQINLQGL